MGEKIDPLPIHEKVYNKLKDSDMDRLQISELYNFIERMHVCNGDNIQEKVCKLLLNQGLTPRQVESIRRKIAWKVKFNRSDSRDIVKGLIKLGWVERRHYYIYLK